MKLILDTHIFLWSLSDPDRIHPDRRTEIETRANTVFLSSVSVAEMMIKASIGKLDVPFDPLQMAEQSGFSLLSFRSEDALLLRDLPFHHRDPFDRMLIAQSMANQFPIVTDDRRFQAYDCRLV